MSNIIRSKRRLSTRQEKYNGSFRESLYNSQQLVNTITNYFKKCRFAVRPQDDSLPFQLSTGELIRLYDITAILMDTKDPSKSHFPIEAKDFCRLINWDATGLPTGYIDKLQKVDNGNLILMFRDNPKLIKKRAEKLNRSEESIYEQLVKDGFAIKQGGRYLFIPYGNFMHELRSNYVDKHLSNFVRSKFTSDGKQEIFSMEGMRPINKLVKMIISHR